MSLLNLLVVGLFPAVVIFAALRDATTMTIPNWLCGLGAVMFVPAALISGMNMSTAGIALAVGFASLVAGIGLFAARFVGGGDAKLFAVCGLWLGWPGINKPEFTVGLALLGLGGGLFIVPIVSVLQHRPSPQTKGAVQGAASWLSWVGIAAAAITQTLLSGPAQLGYGQIFWVCGGVAALAGVFVAWSRPRAMPEMLARWWKR